MSGAYRKEEFKKQYDGVIIKKILQICIKLRENK